MQYFLYKKAAGSVPSPLISGFEIREWKPGIFRPMPWTGARHRHVFLLWWFYYLPRLMYKQPAYSVFFVFQKGKMVHYTFCSAKIYKFPFMKISDKHVGPIWTDEDFRRKGLAYAAVCRMIRDIQIEQGSFCWMSRENNTKAQKLAEKLGFLKVGTTVKRWGGIYAISK